MHYINNITGYDQENNFRKLTAGLLKKVKLKHIYFTI